jgi:GNAT superfamily N-acetyltransferase
MSAATAAAVGGSALDRLYRRLVRNDFFHGGFGDYAHLEAILRLQRQCAADVVAPDHPVRVERVERVPTRAYAVVHGSLESPLAAHAPDILPPEARRARFQLVLSNADADAVATTSWGAHTVAAPRPVCVQYAATGDHGFWRRRALVARPLLRAHGIASLLLETPLYGARKRAGQRRSNLRHVFDLYLMGVAIQHETCALLQWLRRGHWGPFGLAGADVPIPCRHRAHHLTPTARGEHGRSHGVSGRSGVARAPGTRLVPRAVHCRRSVPARWVLAHLPPSSSSSLSLCLIVSRARDGGPGVFTRGVLSDSCNWQVLQAELAARFPGSPLSAQARSHRPPKPCSVACVA